MTASHPIIEAGQSWAIRDGQVSNGHRYITIIEVDADTATVRANYPPCEGMPIPLRAFTSSRLRYCGYRGPGRQPPLTSSDRGTLHPEMPLDPHVTLITSDGRHVCWASESGAPSLAEFDKAVVARDPFHDWRIEFVSPAPNTVFQRQGREWVLIWRGFGYSP